MRHGQPASPSCSRTRQAACTGNYDEPPGRQRCLRRLLVHPTRPSRRPCPWRPCSRGCQRCRGRRGRMGTRLSHCVNLTARACSLSKPAKLSYGAHTHGLMRLAHGAGGPGEGTPGPRRQHRMHRPHRHRLHTALASLTRDATSPFCRFVASCLRGSWRTPPEAVTSIIS